MRNVVAFVAVCVLAAALAVPVHAGPTLGGLASDDVSYVRFVPFEVGSLTGSRLLGKYLYVTSWKNISIYDVSTPDDPKLVSITPIGFKFENEMVQTNGKILLFSEQIPGNYHPVVPGPPGTPPTDPMSVPDYVAGYAFRSLFAGATSVLHVWDVTDKAHPKEIATLEGAGDHTTVCALDCTWGYGSEGTITDLRDPAHPRIAGHFKAPEGHNISEYAPGLLVTATNPIMVLDVRRTPAKPRVLASTKAPEFIHTAIWPDGGNDRIMLAGGEANASPQCDGSNHFMTWDTTNWRNTHKFKLIDKWALQAGDYVDGNPRVFVLGCSVHWFEPQPDYHDGGLVALAAYEHGMRFMRVTPRGRISQVGWFLPYGGSTSAPRWITERIVYAIDYTRGIDILRWNGPLFSTA